MTAVLGGLHGLAFVLVLAGGARDTAPDLAPGDVPTLAEQMLGDALPLQEDRGCTPLDTYRLVERLPRTFTFVNCELEGSFPETGFPDRWLASPAVDITPVREANPEALPWAELTDAKFYEVPSTEDFRTIYRAYSCVRKHLYCGFMVVDAADRIVLRLKYDRPSFVAALDLEGDMDADIVVLLLEWGIHGNGRDCERVYLNVDGTFVEAGQVVTENMIRCQHDRIGNLTWVSAKRMVAMYQGEEVQGHSPGPRRIAIGDAQRVAEVYTVKDGKLRLASRMTQPMPATYEAASLLTFR